MLHAIRPQRGVVTIRKGNLGAMTSTVQSTFSIEASNGAIPTRTKREYTEGQEYDGERDEDWTSFPSNLICCPFHTFETSKHDS